MSLSCGCVGSCCGICILAAKAGLPRLDHENAKDWKPPDLNKLRGQKKRKARDADEGEPMLWFWQMEGRRWGLDGKSFNVVSRAWQRLAASDVERMSATTSRYSRTIAAKPDLSPLAAGLLEDGNPGLAAIVQKEGDGCYEYECMGIWAEEELGINEWDMKDEHIAQWRMSDDYHDYRRAAPLPRAHSLRLPSPMPQLKPLPSTCRLFKAPCKPTCKLEDEAFELWVAKHGGLKRSKE